MVQNGEDPAGGANTGSTVPDGTAGAGAAAPTVTPVGTGVGAGYGEYPATVGALPPLGWTLPTPPEGMPVVVVPPQAPQEPEPPAGRARRDLAIALLVLCLLLGIGAIAWIVLR